MSSSLHQITLSALLTYVGALCIGLAFLAGALDHRGFLVHCEQRESLLLLSFFAGCCCLAATIGAFVGEVAVGRNGRIFGVGFGFCVGLVVMLFLPALLHGAILAD